MIAVYERSMCQSYFAAHEATHAACDLLDMIGEAEPAHEELAYMVQSMTVGIILACEGRERCATCRYSAA